jgi:hypothetical protein
VKSLHVLAALATAAMLVGCNQNNPPPADQPAATAPDVNVNVPPAEPAPDVNVTTPPAEGPDVNIQNNPPPAEGTPPPAQ